MKLLSKPLRLFLCVVALLSLFIHQPAKASDLDDVYYSASMCKPSISTTSNAQSDLRFLFQDAINADFGDVKGGWYNYDNGNQETLICPVPHNRFISGRVNARVVVNDRSNSTSGSNGTVGVQICAQSAQGETVCPLNGGNGGSGNSFIGTKTVEVNISPSVTGNGSQEARWFWLKISLPDVDSQTGASGVLGYRVFRA